MSLLAPPAARADRGALTLELGPALALVPRSTSPLPGTEAFPVLSPGAALGLRYAPGNHFELGVTGFFEAPVNVSTSLLSPDGVVVATVSGTASSWGGLLGARYVGGLGWRVHLGAELGWAHREFSGLKVNGVAGARSGEARQGRDSMVVSAAGGVEWQAGDHLTIGVSPRLGLLLEGVATLVVLLPVTIGFSWYLF